MMTTRGITHGSNTSLKQICLLIEFFNFDIIEYSEFDFHMEKVDQSQPVNHVYGTDESSR